MKNYKTILAVLAIVALALYMFKPRLVQGFALKGSMDSCTADSECSSHQCKPKPGTTHKFCT
jgi:hypothetical protein